MVPLKQAAVILRLHGMLLLVTFERAFRKFRSATGGADPDILVD